MARILVAEDDQEMRRLVVEALRKDGHEVLEAADGSRLLSMVAHRDPSLALIDVIVSDVRMPICGGFELLERLVEAQWRVPFILMTAFGDDEGRRRAERLGALLFDKPMSMATLRAAVNGLVPRSKEALPGG